MTGIELDNRLIAAVSSSGSVIAPGTRLLIVAGTRPLAWADLLEAADGRVTYLLAAVPAGLESEQRLRAWAVSPEIVAALGDRWPASAELFGEVDSLGFGGRTAWIRGGEHAAVRVGDAWWLRVGGQPAVRFDVRFVGPEVSFCEVMALASDPPTRPGTRVALWPSPGDMRMGYARSAVGYVSEESEGVLVWVAAPRGVECPAEPHVDFFRGGRYIGHGIAEQRDERFWYARFIPSSPATSRPSPAGSATQATTTRGASGPARGPRPQVGDDVMIWTKTDIDRRRFVARVFGLTPDGALANAGEADGLADGQELTAYRGGSALGRVTVRRVQRTYAVVAPAANETPELRGGDELRFGPLPPAPVVVGTIDSVADETLFTARLSQVASVPASTAPLLPADSGAPLMTPLAVRAGGRTVAVALLVVAEGSVAGGFALSASLGAPLATGMQLVQEAGAAALAPATTPVTPPERR